VGALAALQAKALVDMPRDNDDLRTVLPEVSRKLAIARRAQSASPYGQRELPRLDLVASLIDYEIDAPDKALALSKGSARRCAELRDWECYGTASQNVGLMSEDTNSYSAAFAAYAEALRNLDHARYPRVVADIQDNLGRLQGKTGQFSSSQR